MIPDNSLISAVTFRHYLLSWYETWRRELPWRGTRSPYSIWISEIILQQTRISQGTDYYFRFMRLFPTVEALAAAHEDEVLKAWEGLGYYSRARNLHAAAKSIVSIGRFPSTYKELLALPGIGEYTAAAIASIVYNIPVPAVDGNAYRVISRIMGIDDPIDTSRGRHHFLDVAQQLIDPMRPGDFNQAMMDFGSLQCVPLTPKCLECPFHRQCQAYLLDEVHSLPVKSHKVNVTHRYLNYFIILSEGKVLIHRRQSGNIWQGLYEPYLVETSTETPVSQIQDSLLRQLLGQKNVSIKAYAIGIRHALTHRLLHADIYLVQCPESIQNMNLPQDFLQVPLEDISRYAFPALLTKHIFPLDLLHL